MSRRGGLAKELSAGLALCWRDLMKFLRDPARMASTFVFPFAFIGILGGSFQSSFGDDAGLDFMAFVFTGVLAQTLFQSSAMGIVSLIEDRENDFSQEIFIAPISRYTIILGKIAGESLVAMAQGLGILVFALILRIDLSATQALALLLASIASCLLGGAFGLLILGNISTQRAANQVFPFIMLPQFFLAGVFNRIDRLPPFLEMLSRISPMRYAVDLTRAGYYRGSPEAGTFVLDSAALNLAVMGTLFLIFLVVGTARFVKRETDR
jgi:ABC-2 type transport system permease protein